MTGLWNERRCNGEKFHGQKEEKEALSGRVPDLNFKVGGNCEAMAGC